MSPELRKLMEVAEANGSRGISEYEGSPQRKSRVARLLTYGWLERIPYDEVGYLRVRITREGVRALLLDGLSELQIQALKRVSYRINEGFSNTTYWPCNSDYPLNVAQALVRRGLFERVPTTGMSKMFSLTPSGAERCMRLGWLEEETWDKATR